MGDLTITREDGSIWLPAGARSKGTGKLQSVKYTRKRALLWKAGGRRCYLCESPLAYHRCTLDHVVPKALGGGDTGNLAPAHQRCNQNKNDRSPTEEELAKLAAINLRMLVMRKV